MHRRAAAGFTLLELVITIAVIMVLATIAVGNYTEYLTRSKRSDAKVALTELANLQTKFFANNLSYTVNLPSLPYPAASMEGHYVLSIPAADATDFTVRATATGTQAANDTGCLVFQLNSVGVQTPADCW